jgi:hypothetical protein
VEQANLSFNEDVEQGLLASCEASLQRIDIEAGEDLQVSLACPPLPRLLATVTSTPRPLTGGARVQAGARRRQREPLNPKP